MKNEIHVIQDLGGPCLKEDLRRSRIFNSKNTY